MGSIRTAMSVIGVAALASASMTATALAAPGTAGGLPFRSLPDLRADANRDGVVSFDDNSDATSDVANLRQGAVFLPNLDDDGARCKGKGVHCHDAADDVVNGAADADDLARVKLKPLHVLAGAVGRVSIDDKASSHVRLFLSDGNTWKAVKPSTKLTAEQLASGITVGVEGKDVMRDRAAWDGRATITVTITSGGYTAHDSVQLQQAPLLTHSHVQAAQKIVASPDLKENTKAATEFVRDYRAAVKKANVPQGFQLSSSKDIWTQDWMEPGYVSMPSASGAHSMRLLIRSDQGRELTELLAFRGHDVGVVETSGDGMGGTRSSFGNLETVPPHTANGKHYPAGRVILGFGDTKKWPTLQDEPTKATQDLIAAQGMQDVIKLDTSWLYVGHVDEFVQFLPAKNDRGFVVAVADPTAAVNILRDAAAKGHGEAKAGAKGTPSERTINNVLADKELMTANTFAAGKIQANVDILVKELDIDDKDVVRIPTMYYPRTDLNVVPGEDRGGELPRDRERRSAETQPSVGSQALAGKSKLALAIQARRDALAKRDAAARSATPTPSAPADVEIPDFPKIPDELMKETLSAFYPGAINSVVTSPQDVAVAKQHGPVIEARDILADAVTSAYAKAGMTVSFVEDYDSYHTGDGEVHCGSNSFRDTTARWW